MATSDATKAVETGQHLATTASTSIVIDERLREVERPWIDTQFAQTVARYLNGEVIGGWEPRDLVAHRIGDVIAHLDPEAPTAIVTHGTAMTAYLTQVAQIDPVTFWNNLTMPDAWLLDRDTMTRVAP